MITRLRVKNFKALRDVEVNLTPIHVLIGPNDSGKTSILDALAAICRSVDHDLSKAFLGSWGGSELVWTGKFGVPVVIEVAFDDGPVIGYGFHVLFAERYRREALVEEEIIRKEGQEPRRLGGFSQEARDQSSTRVKQELQGPSWENVDSSDLQGVKKRLAGVHYYRWDPRFLALPVAPDTNRSFRMEPNGFGLALCLDDILGDDPRQFIRLQERFAKVFPHITSVRLSPERDAYRAAVDDPNRITVLQKADGKGLYFKLRDTDQWVPASQVSDGVLLVLAYLAILYLPQEKRPRVLLIEEPENGIHPKRLREVLGILRELIHEQSHTQVVLTTHSPYALDLFQPDEVTLCTMQDNGEVKTTRLSESSAVMREVGVFTLGEIWTSQEDATIAQAEGPTQESRE
jgi:predicted ATPase